MWFRLNIPIKRFHKSEFAAFCLLASVSWNTVGQPVVSLNANNIASLSLSELANLEITSVSKKQIPLAEAPAALFVITAQQIRRSGAQSLAEALRLAPNLQVARINAQQYAISARGFNSSTSNKLQVLLDGRIVYTPLYSGVFWDAQDVVLDDIERIEVISGPADAAWGANAVNGVINIITRHARDTKGNLVSAATGDQSDTVAFRHGSELQNGAFYRIYGKWSDYSETMRKDGTGSIDAWNLAQVGFRMDHDQHTQKFNLQGDAYAGELEQVQPGEREISGFNLMANLQKQMQGGSTLNLQGYYDFTHRDYPGTFSEDLGTWYLEARQDLATQGVHDFQWGVSWRVANDEIENSAGLAFLPEKKKLHWYSIFAQDEVALASNLRLIASARIAENDYSGVEIMPTMRLAWSPAAEKLYWAAVSRAVRTPSRIDREFYIPGEAPYVIAGGPDFDSETALIYQLGYRATFSSGSSLNISLFHTDYSDLRSLELLEGGVSELANGMEATTSGTEIWGVIELTEGWHLHGGLLYQNQDFNLKPNSTSTILREGNDPEYQWTIKSVLNVGVDKEFDVALRHVGQLASPEVPAYTAVDLRFAWWLKPNFLVSLAASNLADEEYVEFGNPQTGVVSEKYVMLSMKLWLPR